MAGWSSLTKGDQRYRKKFNFKRLLLLFSEEWSDWHAFMIIIISHHGYTYFLASFLTADNYNQLLLLIRCTKVAIRSHEAGPYHSKYPN